MLESLEGLLTRAVSGSERRTMLLLEIVSACIPGRGAARRTVRGWRCGSVWWRRRIVLLSSLPRTTHSGCGSGSPPWRSLSRTATRCRPRPRPQACRPTLLPPPGCSAHGCLLLCTVMFWGILWTLVSIAKPCVTQSRSSLRTSEYVGAALPPLTKSDRRCYYSVRASMLFRCSVLHDEHLLVTA